MAQKERFRPGQPVPDSGIVNIINARGEKTGDQRTVNTDERFPPTPKKRQTYEFATLTRHKKGK